MKNTKEKIKRKFKNKWIQFQRFAVPVGDIQGLWSAIKRFEKEVGIHFLEDQRLQIEAFLWERKWRREKKINYPCDFTWALRELARRDIYFAQPFAMVSEILDTETGEEIDIFETVGVQDENYQAIERWHDIVTTVGEEPAQALLRGIVESEDEPHSQRKSRKKQLQGVLF